MCTDLSWCCKVSYMILDPSRSGFIRGPESQQDKICLCYISSTFMIIYFRRLYVSVFQLLSLIDISRFVGGQLNTCYNALDRHVDEGNGDQVAIIFDSPVSKQMDKITYKELLHEVCHYNSPAGRIIVASCQIT